MLRSSLSVCRVSLGRTGNQHTSRRALFSSTWQSSASMSASVSSSAATSPEHSPVSSQATSDNDEPSKKHVTASELDALREASAKRRRTEWKRRQGGESFLDSVVIHVRAGKGGDGAVAFHREKFQEYGPPAGGDGGRGGDVYLVPTPHLTTLSSVPTRVRADGGGNGSGVWLQGRNAAPTVIRVPLGTVVRELDRDDPRRAKDEWEAADEAIEDLPHEERGAAVKARRFVHFPRYEAENAKRDVFREAEIEGAREEREVRIARTTRHLNPLKLDLDEAPEAERAIDAPLGTRRPSGLGTLIASGGRGGKGNPHFVGPGSRSPKFATRGLPGERVSLALELRILADVGLVGLPNAGKSTLLLALTGGRARTKVADYAFTTLNPVVGVVRCGTGGDFEGLTVDSHVGSAFDTSEDFRFTVADNPGLIARAAENVGLGHAFLKSIERAPVLVYVVDVSGTSTSPEEALDTLRTELEAYRPGMSKKARLILANKADLLVPPAAEDASDGESTNTPDPDAVADARARLAALQAAAAERFPGIPVVPVSAAHGQNLRKVVSLLRGFVEEARSAEEARSSGSV